MLPALRAALDVGDEEGDGAGGKIGHEPLQMRCGSWSLRIVARVDRGQAGSSSTHHPTDPSVQEDGETSVAVLLLTSINGTGRTGRVAERSGLSAA